MTRTDIINSLIKRYGYETYLEIGLDNPDNNYNHILCRHKECVDPFNPEDHKNGFDIPMDEATMNRIETVLTYRLTSDEFFENNTKTYDIVFIDGLHTKEQVSKDIVNALKILNLGGKIVVHDALPPNKAAQEVPRKQVLWNGDVWRAIPEIGKQGVKYVTVDTDFGCCVIDYFDKPQLLYVPQEFSYQWSDFLERRNGIMNVYSVEDFTYNLNRENPHVWSPKDFMLGDYVYVVDHNGEKTIRRINCLSNTKIGFFNIKTHHQNYIRTCEKRVFPISVFDHPELVKETRFCRYVHQAQHIENLKKEQKCLH